MEEKDLIDLRQYIAKAKRMKWLCVGIAVVVMSMAIAAISIKQPQTGVHGAVLVEDDMGQGSSAAKGGLGSLMRTFSIGGIGNASIDNEIGVLASHNNMCRMIESLNLHYIYLEREGLSKHTLYNDTPIRVSMLPGEIEKVKRGFQVIVDIKDSGKADVAVVRSKYLFKSILAEVKNVTLPTTINIAEGTLTVLKTKEFDNFKGSKIEVRCNGTHMMAHAFAQKIDVGQMGKKSDAMEIEYFTPNVEMGIDMVNALMMQYNMMRAEHKSEQASREVEFLDMEIARISEELDNSERKVEKYTSDNRLYAGTSEAAMLWSKDTGVKDMLVAYKSEQTICEMALNILADKENMYTPLPIDGLSDNPAAKVAMEYNDLLLERKSLTRTAKESNSIIRELDTKIASIKELVKQNLERVCENRKIQIENIVAQNNRNVGRLSTMPKHEREYIGLLRDRELKNDVYMFLLEKRTSSAFKMASPSELGYIFEPAYSDAKPSKKALIMFGGAGLVMSVMLPMLLVVVLVWRDKLRGGKRKDEE